MTILPRCGLPVVCGLYLLAVPAAAADSPASGAASTGSAAAAGLQLGPDTTVVTAPLNSSGYPDYVAAMNERLSAGVSRDENFWVLMWPAIGNAERTGEPYIAEVERRLGVTIAREPQFRDVAELAGIMYGTPEGDQLSKQQGDAMSRPWTRDEFPVIARWVDAHEEQLRQTHAACLRPKTFAPLIAGEGNFSMVSILLPHVQSLRSTARLLAARGMLRLAEGDVAGSWQDITDLYRLARHSERGFTLIESLVGYALRAMAQQPLAQWVVHSGLTADELQARWAELEPLLATDSLARCIDCERFMYLDTVLSLMTGRSTSREMLGLLEPAVTVLANEGGQPVDQLRNMREMMFQLIFLGSDVNETLRYGNAVYDELADAMRPSSHLERAVLMKVFEDRIQQEVHNVRGGALLKTYLFASRKEFQRIPAKVLTGMLIPAISAVETAQARVEANAAVLQAAFQVQLHFLQQGAPPLSLGELTASTGQQFTDPFNGEPLRMVIDGRGVVIYSVGSNGVDNGGRNYGEGDGGDDLRAILTIAP